MSHDSDYDAVLHESDPIAQARKAAALQTVYSQRATEMARVRRDAIKRARRQLDTLDKEVAAALGISPGRLSQLLSTGPVAERRFFGIGPVSIGIPYRYSHTDRLRPLIAAEDAATAEELTQLLEAMKFIVARFQIEPHHTSPPDGDTVIVCGPKSAPVAAHLLEADPALRLVQDGGRWWIAETDSGARHGSPADDPAPTGADVAYVARHVEGDRVVVHIAGIHGIGSLGAAHYLAAHLHTLFPQVGDRSCSMVVRSKHDGLAIAGSELAAGPFVW